jgi:acyl carrier protein
MSAPDQQVAVTERITRVVFRAIDGINQARPPHAQVPKSLDTPLVSEGSVLDSLGMVNFVVAVEEEVADEFGVAITIADEKARAQPGSPFRTVGTLVGYIAALLQHHQAGRS